MTFVPVEKKVVIPYSPLSTLWFFTNLASLAPMPTIPKTGKSRTVKPLI
jgi:hypothetical protein